MKTKRAGDGERLNEKLKLRPRSADPLGNFPDGAPNDDRLRVSVCLCAGEALGCADDR